jgi:glutaredoxin-related protein
MIEIYSKPNCVFCERAKSFLRDKQIPFVEYTLDVDFTKEFLLERYTEARSFPVIVIDGFYIGGFDNLRIQINEEIKNTQKLLNEEV